MRARGAGGKIAGGGERGCGGNSDNSLVCILFGWACVCLFVWGGQEELINTQAAPPWPPAPPRLSYLGWPSSTVEFGDQQFALAGVHLTTRLCRGGGGRVQREERGGNRGGKLVEGSVRGGGDVRDSRGSTLPPAGRGGRGEGRRGRW